MFDCVLNTHLKSLHISNHTNVTPAASYMFKVNKRNTRTRYKVNKTPRSSNSVVKFEQVNAGWDFSFFSFVCESFKSQRSYSFYWSHYFPQLRSPRNLARRTDYFFIFENTHICKIRHCNVSVFTVNVT